MPLCIVRLFPLAQNRTVLIRGGKYGKTCGEMGVCSLMKECVLLFGTPAFDCWGALLTEGGGCHSYEDKAVPRVG